MPEDKQALLIHYHETRDALLASIDGISDALMVEPSLDGWSIKDHLAHIAVWDDIRTDEVVRISAGHESAWRMTTEQDEAHNTMSYELRLDLPLAQVRWELANSRQRLLDAIASANERGLDASLYGEAGLRSSHEAIHTPWIMRWRGEKGA